MHPRLTFLLDARDAVVRVEEVISLLPVLDVRVQQQGVPVSPPERQRANRVR